MQRILICLKKPFGNKRVFFCIRTCISCIICIIRTELASVREELAKALDAMTALVAAQEQPASSAPETTEAIPTSSLDSRFIMPRGFPYGLPPYFAPNTAAGVSGTATSGAANVGQIPPPDFTSLHTTLPQSTVFTVPIVHPTPQGANADEIGRASCRERV